MDDFKQRFKAARAASGLTHFQIAVATGIQLRQLSFYENGHAKPSLDSAAKLAEVLGVSVDFLAGHTVVDPQQSPTDQPA